MLHLYEAGAVVECAGVILAADVKRFSGGLYGRITLTVNLAAIGYSAMTSILMRNACHYTL